MSESMNSSLTKSPEVNVWLNIILCISSIHKYLWGSLVSLKKPDVNNEIRNKKSFKDTCSKDYNLYQTVHFNSYFQILQKLTVCSV